MKDGLKKIEWIDPICCNPPHAITHWEFYCELVTTFRKEKGWRKGTGALIGHEWLFHRIQLISGSHRWAAAKTVGILIPVVIYKYDELFNIWGTEQWIEWINNPPLT
jgi:hypothetical protein